MGITAITIDPPQSGYSRFIVKYRDGTAVAGDRRLLPERLDATAARVGLNDAAPDQPLRLLPVLRLAVGGEVFTTSRPLDRAEAATLMQAFAADGEVEYIEIDGVATIQQGV